MTVRPGAAGRSGKHSMTKKPFPPLEFCKRRLSVDEAEAELKMEAVKEGLEISPHWLNRWVAFKDEMLPGDELWYWENFPGPMTGGAGYCVVRDGTSTHWIVTMRS